MSSKYELYCCGSRGSRPVEGRKFNEFGGFTSCYVLKKDDYALVIDCGTGLYEAGSLTLDCTTVDVVITHMHYDHILGMLDWTNLTQCSKLNFYGGFDDWFGDQTFKEFFKSPFWPVQPDFNLHQAPECGTRLQLMDDLSVEFFPSDHPDHAQRIVIYLTQPDGKENRIAVMFDNEQSTGIPSDILSHCDYIIYDGMYTDDEYPLYKGYGHSTWQEACRLASKVNCKRLIVTHHSPDRNDEDLRHFENLARDIYRDTDFARSGQHWPFPCEAPGEAVSASSDEESHFRKVVSQYKEKLMSMVLDREKLSKFVTLGTYTILGLVSLFMTMVNIFTNKRLLMWSTLVFTICCAVDLIIALAFPKLHNVALSMFEVESMALLTFFVVTGTPQGFSAIWSLLLPVGGMIVLGKKRASILSTIMFAILVFFFQTPLGNSYLQYEYTESFMLRFPMAFVAFFAMAFFLETVRERLYLELTNLRDTQTETIANQTSELRSQYFDIVRVNSQLQLRNKALNNMLGTDMTDKKILDMLSEEENDN